MGFDTETLILFYIHTIYLQENRKLGKVILKIIL